MTGPEFNEFIQKYGADNYFHYASYFDEMKSKGIDITWDDILESMSWQFDMSQSETEIQGGVEILSITVPSNEVNKGPKVAYNTYRHPKENAQDLKHGQDGDTNLLSKRNQELLNLSSNDLLSNWVDLIQWTSTSPLEAEAENLITRSFNNLSTDYFSPIMSNAAKNHVSMKNFIKIFGNSLNDQLKLKSIDQIVIQLFNTHPKFNNTSDNLSGLRIMLNDTEYSEIFIQNYTYNPITQEWVGTFYIEVFDHFGLDDLDLKSYQNSWPSVVGGGFASWWILQHKKNKATPFRTKMKFLVELKGNK